MNKRRRTLTKALLRSANKVVDICDLVLEARLDEKEVSLLVGDNKCAILEILKYEEDERVRLWRNGVYYFSNLNVSPEEYLRDIIEYEMDKEGD